ncbi:MAG: hypothetical protein IAE65_04235 [Ignavibacteria bacterium]|nr:hypothetical protein [Ignavibacteria bacterium]
MYFPHKKISSLITFLFVVALIFTSSYNISFAQLNGNYTIGIAGQFKDFKSAIEELKKSGVSGKVNFEIQNGVYVEQIEIPEIAGAGLQNKIIFQSLSGNRDDVELKFAGSVNKNYVINFNGCGFVEFKNITVKNLNKPFNGLIKFSNGSDNIRLYGLKLASLKNINNDFNTAMSFDGGKFENILIEDNLFLNSYFAIHNSLNNSEIFNLSLTDNEFENCVNSVQLINVNGLTAESNLFNNSLYGFSLNKISGVSKINKNKFNKIFNSGIFVVNSQFPNFSPMVISNNLYTGNGGGITIDSGSKNIYVVFNTVWMKENSLLQNDSSFALELNKCDSVKILNNIFVNSSEGYVLKFSDFNLNNYLDFNDYYSEGKIFGKVNDIEIIDFDSFKKIYTSNVNSVFENPLFKDESNPIPLSDKLKFRTETKVLEYVNDDINGTVRNSFTGIGAFHNPLFQTTEKLKGKICCLYFYNSKQV